MGKNIKIVSCSTVSLTNNCSPILALIGKERSSHTLADIAAVSPALPAHLKLLAGADATGSMATGATAGLAGLLATGADQNTDKPAAPLDYYRLTYLTGTGAALVIIKKLHLRLRLQSPFVTS